ncbi:MAG: ribosome maturation factor RimP [Defluviitaleaceae bacterium]|nr:ribosome maturation factor RimP [Defluviitaleaceae bacterium]
MADKLTLLTDLLTPIAQANEVSLYDIELVREGGEKILRIYIDKENHNDPASDDPILHGGVDLNDCERFSRAAEAVLDAHDPIPDAYALEVSSPGIERKLTRDAHFSRYIGHKVQLRLYAPLEGRKNFKGILAAFENKILSLKIETDPLIKISRESIASCKLVVFDE